MNQVGFLVDSLKVGGAERCTVNLANKFAESGCQVVVYVLEGRSQIQLAPTVEVHKIAPIDLFKLTSLSKRICDLDVLFTSNTRATFLGLLFSVIVFGRVNLHPILHSSLTNRRVNPNPIKRFLRNKIYSIGFRCYARKVVCVSEEVRSSLASLSSRLSGRSIVLNNYLISREFLCSVDTYKRIFNNSAREHWAYRTICFAARNDEIKGISRFFEAVQFLRLHVSLKVLFLCPDMDEAELVCRLENYSIPRDAIIHIDTSDPLPYMMASDLVLSLSYYESLGNVIIESLVAGTRVFALNNGSSLSEEDSSTRGLLFCDPESDWFWQLHQYLFSDVCVDEEYYIKRYGRSAFRCYQQLLQG